MDYSSAYSNTKNKSLSSSSIMYITKNNKYII